MRARRRLAFPWRRLLFWALPWLPSARANKGYHDRLYANWGAICDHIRAGGPYSKEDGSFSAIIGNMAEPDTGAWRHSVHIRAGPPTSACQSDREHRHNCLSARRAAIAQQ